MRKEGHMSPKMKEALADITAAGSEGAYRKNWHGATVAALLRSRVIETVPGDDTMVRVPKASTDGAGATVCSACDKPLTNHCAECAECPILSGPCWCSTVGTDPADDEFPQGDCVVCAAPVLYVHEMWIGVDGREHCDGTDVPHAVALGHDENVAAMREASLKLPVDALIRMTEQAARNLDIAGKSGDRGAYRMALGTLREAIALTYPDVDPGAVEDLWSEIGGTVAAAVARLRGHVDPDPELVTVAMAPGASPPAYLIPATERRALGSMLLEAPGARSCGPRWDRRRKPSKNRRNR